MHCIASVCDLQKNLPWAETHVGLASKLMHNCICQESALGKESPASSAEATVPTLPVSNNNFRLAQKDEYHS